jgi:hypothetical protein
VRPVLLVAAACAMAPLSVAAQTTTSPVPPPVSLPGIPADEPIGDPAPIDGAKGVDTDLLCMTVVIPLASKEKEAGKPDEILDGAVNFFLGRVAARQDHATFIANLNTLAAAKYGKSDVDRFASDCLRRYLIAQMDMMFAIGDAMAKAKAQAK